MPPCSAIPPLQGPGLRAMYEPPPIPSHLRLPPRPAGAAPPPLHNQGLVRVAYSDPNTSLYLSSPAILRLDADTLLVSHVRCLAYCHSYQIEFWVGAVRRMPCSVDVCAAPHYSLPVSRPRNALRPASKG